MACETDVEFTLLVYPREYFNGSAEQLLCDPRYPWIWPPENRIPKFMRGSIAAPADNVLTQIFEFKVPDGYWLVIDENMNFYTGTGFVEGSGGIIWGIDINRPIPTPGGLLTGRPVAQFTATTGDLQRMVKVGPLLIAQGDVIRYKVIITDPAVAIGAPNYVHAALSGWLYPMARDV